ncbi:hypothetical protein Fmac_022571 [Flemingia macrophylla]|uniref:Carboxypeptidase n=1 Tax=Flemingia macrophylla TaxID=520843 RepID=A0ABD1M031_9FABA
MTMVSIAATLLFPFFIFAAAMTPEQKADKVTSLPGQPNVSFEHFSGYVRLGLDKEKAFFYWFFEAEESPSEKPLVLWLQGGPGCSSIASGAAQELGPFLVKDKGLEFNRFSWNRVANVIFLESPVGVGFSYTNSSKDLDELGDLVTATDNYAFLLGWLERFPSFKYHDFYITGESYAGHYVPQLADLIYERNKEGKKDSYINLKGILVGNAVLDDLADTKGFVDYAWTHAIISDNTYFGLINNCYLDFSIQNQTQLCYSHIKNLMISYNDINIFNIYSPVCTKDNGEPASRHLSLHELWHKIPSVYNPCIEDEVSKYFNNKDVQKALHANTTSLAYPYTLCSTVMGKWNDMPKTVLPLIQKLLTVGLRIWIYSGDTDGRIPVTSTKYSINKMGLKVKKAWRAWFYKHQVAGWVEEYEGGLTFVTIRGAGHQVPTFAPGQALSLFSHFLSSRSLPSSSVSGDHIFL